MKTKTLLIFMILSTILLGVVNAQSEAAQRAGYHNISYTDTIVHYKSTTDPIVVQNPFIVQGVLTATNSIRSENQHGLTTIGATSGGGYVDGIPRGSFISGNHGSNISLVTNGVWGVSNYGKVSILYRRGGSGNYISAIEVADVPSGFSNLLLMKSGGNVGIGSNPQERLQVAGNVRATGFCIGADCKTSWADVVGTGGSSNWNVSGINVYRSTGNVGIGTNNPQTKLHIDDPSSGTTLLNVSGGSSTVPGNLLVYTTVNTPAPINLELKYGGNSRVRISSANSSYFMGGHVGIGTSAPHYALDVAGFARAQAFCLDGHDCIGSWPTENLTMASPNPGYSDVKLVYYSVKEENSINCQWYGSNNCVGNHPGALNPVCAKPGINVLTDFGLESVQTTSGPPSCAAMSWSQSECLATKLTTTSHKACLGVTRPTFSG